METRIPKPGRILATKAKATTTNAKENAPRNFTKLTASTILGTLDLVKPTTAPLTSRSKTVMDIKANLNKNVTSTSSSQAVFKKPATRPAATTQSTTIARKPIATRTNSGKNVTTTTTTKPAIGTVATTAKPKAAATKRIPPYDYKARFNDLNEKHKVLKEKHDKLKEELAHFDDLPDLYQQCKDDLEAATMEITQLKEIINTFEEENMILKQKNSILVETVGELKGKVTHYEEYCPKVEAERTKYKEECEFLQKEQISNNKEIDHLKEELKCCADQLFSTNMERKVLHNEVIYTNFFRMN